MRSLIIISLLASAWIVTGAVGTPANAATFTAYHFVPDGAPMSLRWAVQQANAAPGTDTVKLATAGTYKLSDCSHAGGPVLVNDAVSIEGIHPLHSQIAQQCPNRAVFLALGAKLLWTTNVQITGGGAGPEAIGGGISAFSTNVFTHKTWFVDNESARGGGVSIHDGQLEAYDSWFTGNSAVTAAGIGGAVALSGVSAGWFDDCEFDDNAAAEGGGAIWSAAGKLSVLTSAFRGNSADYGGAIATVEGSTWLYQSTFDDGEAVGSLYQTSGGGAVAVRDEADALLIDGCTMTGNYAKHRGGAIRVDGAPNVEIHGSQLTGNTAQVFGGAIYAKAAGGTDLPPVWITGSFLGGNTAWGSGGAMRIEWRDIVIEGSFFLGNTSAGGGAISGSERDLVILESSLLANGATENAGSGGAINWLRGSVEIERSWLGYNTCTYRGGALYVYDAPVDIADSTLADNTATKGGGAVSVEGIQPPYVTTLTNSTLTGNVATSQGGHALRTLALSLEHVTIARNGAGGAPAADVSVSWGSFYARASYIGDSDSGAECAVVGSVQVDDGGFNLATDGSCPFDASTSDPEGPAALLGPLGFYGGPTPTLSVLSTDINPIVDAFPAGQCSGHDQRLLPRPVGDCDIGATEYGVKLVKDEHRGPLRGPRQHLGAALHRQDRLY